MGINRFTKYTAPEFIQTYDPYPMEKMMGLAQHQQKRFDQIDSAIGKAYSDAVIKPGLSVEGRRTAKAVNKERKEQLDNLVNNFAETRDVRGAVRGLSELSSNWQSDTRADFVNADRDLMKPILNQTGEEGYGDYYTHKSYNTTTGEHTLGYTDEQIAAGVAPTMADYGAMSNPGSSVAFKTFIDPVKDVITQGMTQDPQGNWITRDGKYLDAQQFLDKAGADINKLSSDGWNIDQPSDADPQTQKFINWRQKEFAEKGKVYTLPDFKDDFLTEAEKYTHNSNKTKVTKGKSLEDGINSSNSAAFLGPNNAIGNEASRVLSAELAEGGEKVFYKNLGFSDRESFQASIVNPSDKGAKTKQTVAINKRVDDEYKLRTNADGASKDYYLGTDENGKETRVPVKTKSEMDKEKDLRKRELSESLDKAYHFRTQAYNALSLSNKNKVQFNEDGSYELKPEEKERLMQSALKSKGIDPNLPIGSPQYLLQNLVNNLDPDEMGEKFKTMSNEEKLKVEEAANMYEDAPNDFLDDPIEWFKWAGKQADTKWMEFKAEGDAAIYQGVSDVGYSLSDNPIKMMEMGVDAQMKEHYGSRTYHNNRIHLQDKDKVGITTQVNPLHHLFSGFAKTNFQVGGKTSTSGVELSQKELETLKDRGDKEINFKGGEFDPEFIEFDFVGKNRFKVYASGHINKEIKDGENKGDHRTNKEYQVDITQEFMNEMGSSEQAQLLYQDAILDTAYDLIPNNLEKRSVYLSADMQKEAKEFFSGDEGAMISKGLDESGSPYYNFTGKVATYDDNNQIQIIEAKGHKDFTRLSQEEMLRVSRDIAVALPYLTQSTTGATMTPAEQNAVKNLGIEYSDVESFDVGAFGLNTQSNASAAKQVQIGFASTAEAIESPVDQLSPKDQIDYSSHLFVNGGSGWNEWDVTKKNSSGTFENATFNKALRALKGVPENPGSIIEALNTNAKTLELSEVNSTMITNIMSEFKSNVLQRKSNGGYSRSDIAKNNETSDSMVAIAVAIAQSGLNSNAIDVNQK